MRFIDKPVTLTCRVTDLYFADSDDDEILGIPQGEIILTLERGQTLSQQILDNGMIFTSLTLKDAQMTVIQEQPKRKSKLKGH